MNLQTIEFSQFCLCRFAYAVLLFLLFSCQFTAAQNVTLEGIIVDNESEEGVPFAHIVLSNHLSIGTSADIDGRFYLEIPNDLSPDSIIISALSYEILRIKFQENTQPLIIKLEAQAFKMMEIVVLAEGKKEDPATSIMDKVIKSKSENNYEKHAQFQCEKYNKLELDFENLNEEWKEKKVLNQFDFIFENIDSSSNDIPYIPIFISEKISKLSFKADPYFKQEELEAAQMSAFENKTIDPFLESFSNEANIYNNWIDVFNDEFLSPIANTALNAYNYQIQDTVCFDNDCYFNISFSPKRILKKGFYGNAFIHWGSYAIKKFSIKTPPDVNINFVDYFSLSQEFKKHTVEANPDQANNPINVWWLPIKETHIARFTELTEPAIGTYFKSQKEKPNLKARKKINYYDYKIGASIKEALKDKKGNKELSDDAEAWKNKKDQSYWESKRPERLTKNEEQVFEIIDKTKELPIVKTGERIFISIFSGFVPIGKLEFGNIYNIYQKNWIDGDRLNLALRTGIKFSKKILISGNLGYGFKNQKFRYGLEFLYLPKKDPRTIFGLSFKRDVNSNLNLSSTLANNQFGGENSQLFRRKNIPFKLFEFDQLKVWGAHELKNGLTFGLSLFHQRVDPNFEINFKTTNYTLTENDNFIRSEVEFQARYAYREKFIDGTFNRISLGSKYPIIQVSYKRSIPNLFDSNFSAHYFKANLSYRFKTAPLGYAIMEGEYGISSGNLPFFFMFNTKGNESAFLNKSGFNLLWAYEYSFDEYESAFWEQHFNGFFLDKIPIINKLKLRSILHYRILLGSWTQQNQLSNLENLWNNDPIEGFILLRELTKIPYMEVGIGLENILHFLRIDAIWRINYRDSYSPNFGIRGSFVISF